MGNGNDTVKALGCGNDTISLGTGAGPVQLGSGSSAVTTGGAATLFGGGNGDKLLANRSGAQILGAGTRNETLTGSSVGGASDTFVGSGGATTVIASPSVTNVFEFIHDSAGGTEFVTGFTSIGQVDLHQAGYASNSLASVASQNNGGGNLNIALSNGTQLTFQNITSPLTNRNFS